MLINLALLFAGLLFVASNYENMKSLWNKYVVHVTMVDSK
jgi:hypothetical protein